MYTYFVLTRKFNSQAAVPKYLKLEMLPASATVIPSNTSGQVSQEIRLINSQQGEKNIMLKLKIGYKAGGNPVTNAQIIFIMTSILISF